MMIYLAKITKLNVYSADTTVACEAFSTFEKAAAFMFSEGMSKAGYGLWVMDNNYDCGGEILELEVK